MGDGQRDCTGACPEIEDTRFAVGGNQASAISTSVSVSGRGMSTAGDTAIANPQNSRVPVR
jgi:hypothetical protein